MAVRFVDTRSDLKKTDSVDWKSVADDGEALVFTNHLFAITTAKGLKCSIVHPLLLVRKRQGPARTWTGNFKENDGVLATDHDIGPLVITFDTPVKGAGAQIQADGAPLRFKGLIRAFNGKGQRLAQFERKGLSNNQNDNSAIFLGILSDDADIQRIEFSTLSMDPSPDRSTDFAINRLDLKS